MVFSPKNIVLGAAATSAVAVVSVASWGGSLLGSQTVGESLKSRGYRLLNTDTHSDQDKDQWEKIINENKSNSGGSYLLSMLSSTSKEQSTKIREIKEECRSYVNTGNSSWEYSEKFNLAQKYCSVLAK